jgi:CBS domain-containing protein
MQCKEIMKHEVEFVVPGETVQKAAMTMRDHNIGFLPVCDETRKVLGTITDRDLALRVLAPAKQPSTRVQDVMNRDVISFKAQVKPAIEAIVLWPSRRD